MPPPALHGAEPAFSTRVLKEISRNDGRMLRMHPASREISFVACADA